MPPDDSNVFADNDTLVQDRVLGLKGPDASTRAGGSPDRQNKTTQLEEVNATPNDQRDWELLWASADAELPNSGMIVTVSKPAVVGGFVNRHIEYLVETQPQNWAVRRRFNDFIWLREILEKRYPGLLVPSLPPKELAGKAAGKREAGAATEYVRTRTHLLGVFAEQVARTPYLRPDASVAAFLSAPTPLEWEAQKHVTGRASVLTDTSPGCNRWKEDIHSVQVPSGIDRILVDTVERLNRLVQIGQAAVEASKELLESSRLQEQNLKRLNESFGALAEMEAQLGYVTSALAPAVAKTREGATGSTEGKQAEGRTSGTEPQRLEEGESGGGSKGGNGNAPLTTADLLLMGAEAVDGWWRQEARRPEAVRRALMAALAYEQQQVLALVAAINGRMGAQRALYRAEATLKRHQDQLALMETGNPARELSGASFLNAFTNRGALEHDIVQDTNAIQVAEKSVDMITKGLIFCEIHRFNAARKQNLSRMIRLLGGSQLLYGRELARLWQNTLEAVQFQPEECVDGAKHIIMASVPSGDLEEAVAPSLSSLEEKNDKQRDPHQKDNAAP